ncbi:MAG: hypothetical protein JSR73_05085 [Proteobacteria bacterium]|nr:hypothetical protein [Pseudomonadota bacterium]
MPLKRKRPDDAHALVDNLLASIEEFLAARDQHDSEERASESPDRDSPHAVHDTADSSPGAEPGAL